MNSGYEERTCEHQCRVAQDWERNRHKLGLVMRNILATFKDRNPSYSGPSSEGRDGSFDYRFSYRSHYQIRSDWFGTIIFWPLTSIPVCLCSNGLSLFHDTTPGLGYIFMISTLQFNMVCKYSPSWCIHIIMYVHPYELLRLAHATVLPIDIVNDSVNASLFQFSVYPSSESMSRPQRKTSHKVFFTI